MKRSAKRHRPHKQQMGQFMTPEPLARGILFSVLAHRPQTVLEPSFGEGAFLLPAIEHFIESAKGSSIAAKLGRVLTENVWGVELDEYLYERTISRIIERWGALPKEHNLVLGDYFGYQPELRFEAIVGNPPFGGTFDSAIEDELDKRFGNYAGHKLKKETYSFFVAKALTELAPQGHLAFICSDTFLTIKTMAGLRKLLIDRGRCKVESLANFSEETSYDMVVLELEEGEAAKEAEVLGERVSRDMMESTGNFSWLISPKYAPLFDGPTIGEYMVATGGMTIGKNELFVREITGDAIEEHFTFSFDTQPITLADELSRARLGKLSAAKQRKVRLREESGAARRVVKVLPRQKPLRISLPHPDYRPYNKASSARLFAPPTHVVFWKDDGDAVLTFKKSGPWYLHGVGGGPFFGREGLTWQLVSPRINARYLPEGYILDSGAPCGFLREGIDPDELWFILGWLQAPLATEVLKGVLNHTRNIQGKDVERLPYPWWVSEEKKGMVVEIVRSAVESLRSGEEVSCANVEHELDALFQVPS